MDLVRAVLVFQHGIYRCSKSTSDREAGRTLEALDVREWREVLADKQAQTQRGNAAAAAFSNLHRHTTRIDQKTMFRNRDQLALCRLQAERTASEHRDLSRCGQG